MLKPVIEIITVVAVFIVLSMLAQLVLVRLLRYRNSVLQWLASLGLLFGGGPFLWFHLNFVDRYYLNWGPKYRDRAATPLKKAVAASAGTANQSSLRGVN